MSCEGPGTGDNLLAETVSDIMESGHGPGDIVFIGSLDTGHRCTWAEFQTLANIEYDGGFGSQKVAHDLRIVFSDGTQMWRHEYDGSESWHFSHPAVIPEQVHPISRLVVREDRIGGETVEACCNHTEEGTCPSS